MPQVVTDPSVNTGIVSNGGLDLFSYPDTPSASVLDFQLPTGQPQPAGTATATGMVTPDLLIQQRLRNFPGNIYDLSSTSVLVHFMSAMLGDAGVGQVRKRQLLAQLQNAVTSTHFYDLDTFYGALFGAIRGPSGTLPDNPATGVTVSPYTDLATPDAWDEVLAIDALFRERIIQLARAISLGGTIPGLRAMGEAIIGGKCNIYEVWKLIDTEGAQSSTTHTWTSVQTTYTTWSAFVSGTTWLTVAGAAATLIYGGMGINARNEVIIQPEKNYGSDQASIAQQQSDAYGIASVTEVLKPANTLLSVSSNGAEVLIPVAPASIWADSDNKELVHHVTPASPTDPAYAATRNAYGQQSGSTLIQGTPVFSRKQGGRYSFASDVTTAQGQASTGGYTTIISDSNYDQVTYPSGSTVAYTAAQAVMDPQTAATARTASGVAVTAAPYSGPRVPVTTAA